MKTTIANNQAKIEEPPLSVDEYAAIRLARVTKYAESCRAARVETPLMVRKALASIDVLRQEHITIESQKDELLTQYRALRTIAEALEKQISNRKSLAPELIARVRGPSP